MPVKLRKDGALTLIEKLESVKNGGKLSKQDIKDIKQNLDIMLWLCSYEKSVPNVEIVFEKILSALYSESPAGLNQWGKSIDQGLRKALDNLDKIKSTLLYLNEYDWAPSVWNALKYLPDGTKIDVEVIPTIDNINGAMFSGERAFVSLLYISPSLLKGDFFSHEFHHIGVDYWWRRIPLISHYEESDSIQESWLLNLLKYLVSEGIAGTFCNPSVKPRRMHHDDTSREHNPFIISESPFSNNSFDLFEELINAILNNDVESIHDFFNRFTAGLESEPLPPGQFLSARMVWAMNKSSKISRQQIIGLIKNPLLFFRYYNVAAKELDFRRIHDEIMDPLDILVDEMITSGNWTCDQDMVSNLQTSFR